jgi:hypothetical protein
MPADLKKAQRLLTSRSIRSGNGGVIFYVHRYLHGEARRAD